VAFVCAISHSAFGAVEVAVVGRIGWVAIGSRLRLALSLAVSASTAASAATAAATWAAASFARSTLTLTGHRLGGIGRFGTGFSLERRGFHLVRVDRPRRLTMNLRLRAVAMRAAPAAGIIAAASRFLAPAAGVIA